MCAARERQDFLRNPHDPTEPIMGARKLNIAERNALERMLERGVFRMPYTPGTAHCTLILDAATDLEKAYYDSLLADYISKHRK